MSTLIADPLAKVFEREIARFVAASARQGGGRSYRNRRAAVRYHRSCPLFIARLDDGFIEDIPATLHDVSTGGIGFYCDYEFPVSAILGVKLFWSEPCAPRIPVNVRHHSHTSNGILTGGQFLIHDPLACRLIEKAPISWYG